MRRLVLPTLVAFCLVALPAAFTPPPVPQGAYTAAATTPYSNAGTLTTVSGSVRYQITGKRVDVTVTATITTNGTGAGSIVVPLPFTVSGAKQSLTGFTSIGSSNKTAIGIVAASSATVTVVNYDNSYPGADGAVVTLTGSLELS